VRFSLCLKAQLPVITALEERAAKNEKHEKHEKHEKNEKHEKDEKVA